MTKSLENQAIELCEMGFNVFPLGGFDETIPEWFRKKYEAELTPEELKEKWCKTPRFKWSEYRDNPADEEQIEKWWTQYPTANIGIITDDLVVIDADNEEADKWCMKNAYSPVRVKTSKGRHFYFKKNPKLDIRSSVNEKLKLDRRAIGGYIVGAGSIHGTGVKYQWDIEPGFSFIAIGDLPMITAEIWDKIQDYLEVKKNVDNIPTPKPSFNIDDKPEKGGRNDHLSRAIGVLINRGDTEEQAQKWAYNWNDGLPAPLLKAEVEKTVKSVFQTADTKLNALADQVLTEAKAPDDFDFSKLPSLLQDYMEELGGRTEANPVMILKSFLASLSAFMRHKVYFPQINPDTKKLQWFGDLHPNIWVLSIMPSGRFKSTALNIGAEILVEKECRIEEIIECSEDKEERREEEKKINIVPNKGSVEGLFDHFMKTGGGVILNSEFGAWLKNMESTYNASMKPTLTDWYDVPDFAKEITRGKGSIILRKPYLSIAGVSTAKWIKTNLNVEDEIASGFLARFLFFTPFQTNKTPAALPSEIETDIKLKEKIVKIFDFFDGRATKNPILFKLDENSRQVYEHCHSGICDFLQSQDKATQELLDPYLRRWPPYVLKLAMLIQPFIDIKSGIISMDALTAAYSVVKYAATSTVWIVENELTTSDFQESAEKILKYIANRGGSVQRHKLLYSRQLSGGVKKYDYVIEFLKESRKIWEIKNGGKKDIIYRLTQS